MESSKNVYEVQIAGMALKLRSSHDQETVNQLVSMVDQKLQETLEGAPTISFQNALLLTALNLAEDQMLVKKAARKELVHIEQRAQKILDQIEEDSQGPSSALDN
jgi:cell division protein ZapA